jgi:hypothetical protein
VFLEIDRITRAIAVEDPDLHPVVLRHLGLDARRWAGLGDVANVQGPVLSSIRARTLSYKVMPNPAHVHPRREPRRILVDHGRQRKALAGNRSRRRVRTCGMSRGVGAQSVERTSGELAMSGSGVAQSAIATGPRRLRERARADG